MKLKWWQRMLCRLMCHRFIEAMPKQDVSGTWVACALAVTEFSRREKKTVEVQGLKNAYEVSRWLALKLDLELPSCFGVDWAVRRAYPQSSDKE